MTTATARPGWTGGTVIPVGVLPRAADPAGDIFQAVFGGSFVTPAAGIGVRAVTRQVPAAIRDRERLEHRVVASPACHPVQIA